jgi:leader peptidase (prepilin peptidase) / N-methyltransferase
VLRAAIYFGLGVAFGSFLIAVAQPMPRESALRPVSLLIAGASGALFVAAATRFQRDSVAGLLGPFLSQVLVLAVIDVRRRVIPNRIVYPALLLAAAFILVAWTMDQGLDAPRAGLGLLAYGGGLLIVALLAPHAMGMGDVKLAALIGLVLGALGLAHVGAAAAAAILLGGVGALVMLSLGEARRRSTMPFGPFLAAGAVLGALLGREIGSAYLGLIG